MISIFPPRDPSLLCKQDSCASTLSIFYIGDSCRNTTQQFAAIPYRTFEVFDILHLVHDDRLDRLVSLL